MSYSKQRVDDGNALSSAEEQPDSDTETALATDGRHFIVFNLTDGVVASPDPLTFAEAEAFVEHFPKRCERQGFYRTASGDRIPPDAVLLLIVPATKSGLRLAINVWNLLQ